MDKNELRKTIKEEFRYYLEKVARSARRTNDGYNLGKTAIDSFLSFVEPQKLFDYDPEKWSHIESIYDITDNNEAKEIAEKLFKDDRFVKRDSENNKFWRSGSIQHYICFLNARSFFKRQKGQSRSNNSSSKTSQIIFYGAPGTGKSHTINEITEKEDVIRTTFHPDTDYSTFVGSYKPTTIDVPVMTVIGTKAVPVENQDGTLRKESKIVYEFVSQAFLHAYVEAWRKYANPNVNGIAKQFLVIEEINRGNCAQIFGDLFQLLDRNEEGFSDYPIKADADMAKQLKKQFEGLTIDNPEKINMLYKGLDVVSQVLEGDILLLPNNLYIWATMNTSDQSLFPIDSAFKRRWDWQYMPIADGNKNWRIEVNGLLYDWWDFLERINAQIGLTTNSEDKKIGYYFCKANDKLIDAKTFVGKVIFYLWNDVFKDYDLEGDLFKDEDNNKLTFDKFYSVQNSKTIINESKVELFMKNLGVEPLEEDIIDEEEVEDDNEENDDTISQRKSSNIEIYYDGEKIEGKNSIVKFANLIEKIDVEKVAELGIIAIKKSSIALLSKTKLPEDTLGGYGKGMRQIGDYWMVAKYGNPTKIRMINEIADKLSLNIRAELIR